MAQEVSLVALLASPQAHDGKLIRVEGYFDGSHFENCQLFLSKGDFEFFIERNSVFVEWPGCRDRRLGAKMQRRYARVEGIFEADIGTGFGSFSAIRQVRSLQPLESRADFKERISAPWWLDLWPWLPLGILFVLATTATTYLIMQRVQSRR